jgi:hypothetical protein
MAMTKKSSFIILGVICLTLILHPRLNHLLTQKFQPNTAYGGGLSAVQLWEIREFNSIGFLQRLVPGPHLLSVLFPLFPPSRSLKRLPIPPILFKASM